MACVSLAAIMWIVDVQHVKGWTKPWIIYGMNPITAFVGSGVMARLIYSIVKVPLNGTSVPLQAYIYLVFFASWLDAKDASLAFAVTFVGFWFVILWAMYRKRIFLKV
jgi:predicted acyltransferase